jgi:hypothetical protein
MQKELLYLLMEVEVVVVEIVKKSTLVEYTRIFIYNNKHLCVMKNNILPFFGFMLAIIASMAFIAGGGITNALAQNATITRDSHCF